ncbi:MAG: hypothetical protein QXT73_07700, partial [Candidatus Methanomethylicaceae archaeon]
KKWDGMSKKNYKFSNRFYIGTNNDINKEDNVFLYLFMHFRPNLATFEIGENTNNIGPNTLPSFSLSVSVDIDIRVRYWIEFFDRVDQMDVSLARRPASADEGSHTYVDFTEVAPGKQPEFFTAVAPELDPTIGKTNAELKRQDIQINQLNL